MEKGKENRGESIADFNVNLAAPPQFHIYLIIKQLMPEIVCCCCCAVRLSGP